MVVAHFTRTRGIKGELCAIGLTSDPGRYQALRTVYAGGSPYEVERVWYHKDRPIFKLRGVDSINDAERLVGMDVAIPVEERLKLPDGEYFFSDLVGCRLVDRAGGGPIGTIVGWQEIGEGSGGESPVLLEVDDGRGGEPVLVPFVRSILKEFDVEGREIRADLPPGLLDLNR